MTGDSNPLADCVGEFGDEWARANTCGVRLHDAHHFINLQRSDTTTSGGAASDWMRRGDKWIRAVVEIEHRPLGALEEEVLLAGIGTLDQVVCVGDVWSKALTPGSNQCGNRIGVNRLGVVGGT